LCAAAGLSVGELDQVVSRCRQVRAAHGLPVGLWTARAVAEVLHDAVVVRGWPGQAAVPGLLAVAADPATRSPARLSCPGPWWEAAEIARRRSGGDARQAVELAELEALLAETGGRRVGAQRRARQQLAEAGEPVTGLAVARLAVRLLGLDQTGALDQVNVLARTGGQTRGGVRP
jgi:hypothetical protein